MRTIFKLTGFICVVALTGVFSCSDSENHGDLSLAAKKYLSMRMGSNNATAESMSGPVNQSFQTLFRTSNGRVADTTLIDYYWTCAKVFEIDNTDGSTTTIYDYGDGCEDQWGDYKNFTYGKYLSTYKYIDSRNGNLMKSVYSYHSKYDNYGGIYNDQNTWLMNGYSLSTGESEYDSGYQKFSGNYDYESETAYRYDSVEFTYRSKSSALYTHEKYILESSETKYTSEDNYYHAVVLEPLVSDYSCYRNFLYDTYSSSSSAFSVDACYLWMIYVQGRERVTYKDGDDEGSFEIDYGDGECDFIVTIRENDNITKIDLRKNPYF